MIKKLNKKEKDQLKKLLLSKKIEIIQKLSTAINESKEMETNIAQDIVDKAETSYTKEFLLSLSDADREKLVQIDSALKRLDRNEYGICQLCGQRISAKRLDALPWTPYCITCQEKAEEERQAE